MDMFFNGYLRPYGDFTKISNLVRHLRGNRLGVKQESVKGIDTQVVSDDLENLYYLFRIEGIPYLYKLDSGAATIIEECVKPC